jgi:hypothetical protein
MRTIDMEDVEGSYNHEDEFMELHIILGNVEIESNGHRKGKVGNIDLVDTMRIL